jgi:anhydro-N-acetylmuramic acid kinase
LERITHYKTINLIIPSPELIEYKEALIFGLLGILKLRNENNCLKSVTGAKKDHSSGVIFFSKNELEKG